MDRCIACWRHRWETSHAEAVRADTSPRTSASAAAGDDEADVPVYRVRVDGFQISRRIGVVFYSLTVTRGNATWPLRRRFRQIVSLHNQLEQSLGRSSERRRLPGLPPRVTSRSLCFGQTDQGFLAQRVLSLERYFNELLRVIPYVDQSEALQQFLCSVDISTMGYDTLLDLGQAIGRVVEPEHLDPASIAALPKRGASKAGCSALGRCVICQEDMEPEEDIRVLPCRHEYHFDCVARWLGQSNSCCICQCPAMVPPLNDADTEKRSHTAATPLSCS